MSKWVSLNNHSFFSLNLSICKPDALIGRAKSLGMEAIAITDYNSISGAAKLAKAAKEHSIKLIQGCRFNISQQDASIHEPENRTTAHINVLAKNRKGWKNLIKAVSLSNRPEYSYYKPRLDLARLAECSQGEFIVCVGKAHSILAEVLFTEPVLAYAAPTYEAAKSLLKSTWLEESQALLTRLCDLFGKTNVFLSVCLVDKSPMPATQVIANALRGLSNRMGLPCVATSATHYVNKDDAADQRVMLASKLKSPLSQVDTKLQSIKDDELNQFFHTNNYYLPSPDEILDLHAKFPNEVENSLRIASLCENYSILDKPQLPKFDCPNNEASPVYFRQLCRDGWQRKIQGRISRNDETKYAERVKMELDVLINAGLSDYFLIVHDYMAAARSRGETCTSRGSVGGSLVAYLLDISHIDPIPADLYFERFYNAGRNTKDHVSLPDIDGDFEPNKRELSINYIKKKYGEDKVAQIATFGRMQGRAALKDVLRAHEACSFDEMNKITEYVPDEAKISDELQEMREAGEEPSIVRWALENNTKHLKEWCFLNDKGEFDGEYGKYFAQAARLEGVKRSQGKHAAGLVVAPTSLAQLCPMVYDKTTKSMIAAMEFTDLESMGLVKFDILGVSALSKVARVQQLVKEEELCTQR